MKIAVASSDGVSISRHFGRSACFIVFHTDEGKVVKKEIRENRYSPHALGQCNAKGDEHGHHHDHAHDHQHHAHSHTGLINALHDCDTVICCGMGFRAVEDLRGAGINPYIIETELTPDDAVQIFLSGELQPAKKYCDHHEKGGQKSA